MHPGTNSLWLYTVPSVGADYPVEVAAGIDKLVITYGVDTDGDRTANEYLTADAVPAASWSSVVSVRIEIDASTTQSNTSKSSASGRLTSKLVEVVALRNIAS
jgi:type IV pilus assembly protein PilW